MDRGNLADLALCRSQWKSRVAIALVWDVACVGQRDVCLHLAFLRQPRLVRVGRDGASRDDGRRKLHIGDRGLVDLAIVQKITSRIRSSRTDQP